jgi:MFS transporter, AAHS family, 4-hydroxybenzoate transporter
MKRGIGAALLAIRPASIDVPGRAAPTAAGNGAISVQNSSLNVTALGLCLLAMVCDGFDLTVIALVMPAMARDWGIGVSASFGAVFSAAIVGIMIGAPLFGTLADKIGRKKAMIASLLLFAGCSLATIATSSIPQLVFLRFVGGIGMGGVVPMSVVISAELTPPRRRATVIAIVGTGATLGAAASGFKASWMLGHEGWRSLFILGAAAPLVVAIASVRLLPETASHLVASQVQPSAAYMSGQDRAMSVKDLFRGQLAPVTPSLWSLFVIIGLATYFIHSWAPTLLSGAGYGLDDVSAMMGTFNACGVVAGLSIGWPIDRFGLKPLVLLFLFAAPLLASFPAVLGFHGLLLIAMAATGVLLFALQIGLNGVAASLYPKTLRAKGVGWGPRQRPDWAGPGCVRGRSSDRSGRRNAPPVPDRRGLFGCRRRSESRARTCLKQGTAIAVKKCNSPEQRRSHRGSD